MVRVKHLKMTFFYITGSYFWYDMGLLHREDGPAIEWSRLNHVWYYHGQLIDCKNQKEFERLIRLKAFW